MAITFSALKYIREAEIPSSGDGGSERIAYVLKSNSAAVEDQLNDVRAWLNTPGNVPAVLGGQEPASSSVTELGEGVGYWQVTLTYSTEQAERNKGDETPEAGDHSWSFTISSAGQRYTMSKSLVSVTPSDAQLMDDYGGKPYLLGLDVDGNLEGYDVLVPEPSWEETWYMDPANVTQNYRVTCLNLVGKVNADTFKGCAAKTVLLTSISGQQTGSPNWPENTTSLWEISFSFIYRPSESLTWQLVTDPKKDPPKIDPHIINKTGWEVYDLRYVRAKYQGAWVALPKQVLVQAVYETGDFSLLGIGT